MKPKFYLVEKFKVQKIIKQILRQKIWVKKELGPKKIYSKSISIEKEIGSKEF